MIGLYFSGTGNTRRAVTRFVQKIKPDARVCSIEEEAAADAISAEPEEIVLGYPVYYSRLPKIMADYLCAHAALFKGKRVFVIATMGFASGDGSRQVAGRLKSCGAKLTGSLHVRMPDNISDVGILPIHPVKTPAEIVKADEKIDRAAQRVKQGKRVRVGFTFGFRVFFGSMQRLFCGHFVTRYHDRVQIDANKCVGCGTCKDGCPMHNIALRDNTAVPLGACASCYRCVNRCPVQAITIIGKKVGLQYTAERFSKTGEEQAAAEAR